MSFDPPWVMPIDPGKPPPLPDPKQLVLITPGVEGIDGYFINNAFPDATKLHLNTGNFNQQLETVIAKQVKEAGDGKPATLSQITIDTHGGSGYLDPKGPTDKHPVSIDSILDSIGKLQDTIRHQPGGDPNFKVADRLVIMGCDSFASLSDQQIKDYSDKAKKLGIDIVGSTDMVYTTNDGRMDGRFVKFGKDGTVSRDSYDTATPIPEKQQALKNSPDPYPGGGEWVGCFTGKDMDTGMACRDAPAMLSTMFKQVGTSALEHGTPEEKKLAADMKTIERQYDNGAHVMARDEARSDDMRKLAEDTGARLAQYLRDHPDSKTAQHVQKSLKISPDDAASQIQEQVNLARLDRVSQAAGSSLKFAGVTGGTTPDSAPAASNAYAAQPPAPVKAAQIG